MRASGPPCPAPGGIATNAFRSLRFTRSTSARRVASSPLASSGTMRGPVGLPPSFGATLLFQSPATAAILGYIVPVPSMTAKRRSSRSAWFIEIRCRAMLTPMKTGTSIMPMMNALLRIAIDASDAATMKSLSGRCMIASGPRDAHEDVVQGWPRHLEVLHGRARGQLREETLGVALHPHFLHLAVVVHAFDLGHRRQRGGAAVRAHAHGVEPVRGLDLVERAVEHLVAAEDHEDPIAHLLGGRHVVRGEDDRRPGSLPLQHRIFQYLGVH